MLAATHTITGGAIGAYTDSIAIAFILGFLSHFILDIIPHWSFKPTELFKAGAEFGGGLFFVFLLLFNSGINPLPVIAGVLGANLPDIIHLSIFYFFPRYKNSFFPRFHHYIQPETSFWPGIISQVIIFAVCVCLFLIAG